MLSIMIINVENGFINQNSNPRQVCVSLNTNVFGKNMNLSVLLLAMSK